MHTYDVMLLMLLATVWNVLVTNGDNVVVDSTGASAAVVEWLTTTAVLLGSK